MRQDEKAIKICAMLYERREALKKLLPEDSYKMFVLIDADRIEKYAREHGVDAGHAVLSLMKAEEVLHGPGNIHLDYLAAAFVELCEKSGITRKENHVEKIEAIGTVKNISGKKAGVDLALSFAKGMLKGKELSNLATLAGDKKTQIKMTLELAQGRLPGVDEGE